MGLVQLFLIWTYFNASTYTRLISLASALILLPYLLSALFQVLVSLKGGTKVKAFDLVVGVLGSAYGLWLLYAAGLVYLLYTAIFYVLGLPFYIWARREQKVKGQGLQYVLVGTCCALLRHVRLRRPRAGHWRAESMTAVLNHRPVIYDCTVLGGT
jgi:arcD